MVPTIVRNKNKKKKIKKKKKKKKKQTPSVPSWLYVRSFVPPARAALSRKRVRPDEDVLAISPWLEECRLPPPKRERPLS